MIINPKVVKKGITDEQLDQWAAVNTQLEKAVGPYTLETTTAAYFTFNGNACTGYVGDNSLPEIVIPRSYSMSQETITMNGAPIIKDQIIPTLTSFTNVVFCKTDGSNQVTYTSASQLSSNFNTDFPDDDVVLVSLQVSSFFGQLENKLNAILSAPFIASTIITGEKTYYTNVEDFTSTLTITSNEAYFSGSAIASIFFDGNDYQVTRIEGSSTSAVNPKSGFKNYTNRIILLNNINTIDTHAFAYCSNLTSIEIPSSVTSIGNNAFYYCDALATVTFGDNSQLASIGMAAFSGCDALTSITIPSSVTSIGEDAFSYCDKLENITVDPSNANYCSDEYGVLFNKDKTELIQYPRGNTRTQYTIPSSVKSIGDYAFDGCSALATVTFGDNSQLESIGFGAFNYCSNLTSIEIPSSVTSIGDLAFYNCSALKTVTFGDNSKLESIGMQVFYNCSNLTSIEIPSSVTIIGSSAFRDCYALTSITIPSSVTSIGINTFDGCSALETVTLEATTPPTIQSSTFDATVQTFYVPAESVEAYKTATNWANYADKIFAKGGNL